MKKQIAKIALFSLIATALVAVPAASRAEDNAAGKDAAGQAAPAPAKKHGALPFHGKVAAVDATAMTVTVGSLTLNVTSETKITKDGKPATLADITAGEMVRGSYKKSGERLNAAVIHVGEKAPKGKKKAE